MSCTGGNSFVRALTDRTPERGNVSAIAIYRDAADVLRFAAGFGMILLTFESVLFRHLLFLGHPKSPIAFDSRLFRGNPSNASSAWNLRMSGWAEALVG
jgi:hypothetical protein